MNNSRGKNEQHSLKLGQFNRVAFKQCGEALFDKQFGFNRLLNETMAFANINKNGIMEQKMQLDVLREGAKLKAENFVLAKTLVNEVSNGFFASVREMFEESGKDKDNFLNILLEPTFDPYNYQLENEEKRRRKEHSQSQGLSR